MEHIAAGRLIFVGFRNLIVYGIGRMVPDRVFIQIKHLQWFGRFCNLKDPQTYNEKLQWLKLYDRRSIYTVMVDKYEAKRYIAERIGGQYVIPVVGGPWDRFEKIDFDALPDQFVLKTTHDCGGVLVCKDKSTFDKASAKKFLNGRLRNNYYLTAREWPYKNVKPHIFAEAYMRDETSVPRRGKSTEQLTDYKFFCFDGEVKALFIATDRNDETTETKFDFFDADFNHLDFVQGHPNADVPPPKPVAFDKMKELAAELSRGIPQIRVDFYEVGNRIYVGELTLFHFSGNVPFKPEKWDYIFGSWIRLPNH